MTLKASPRLSAGMRSATMAGPRRTNPTPANPMIARKKMNRARLVLEPHTARDTRKITYAGKRTQTRPYISLTGATIKGPRQYPIVYIETVKDAKASLLECKSAIKDGNAGSKAVEHIALCKPSCQQTSS